MLAVNLLLLFSSSLQNESLLSQCFFLSSSLFWGVVVGGGVYDK